MKYRKITKNSSTLFTKVLSLCFLVCLLTVPMVIFDQIVLACWVPTYPDEPSTCPDVDIDNDIKNTNIINNTNNNENINKNIIDNSDKVTIEVDIENNPKNKVENNNTVNPSFRNTNDNDQSLTQNVEAPKIPTIYPAIGIPDPMTLPSMRHPDMEKAPNTSISLWEVKKNWSNIDIERLKVREMDVILQPLTDTQGWNTETIQVVSKEDLKDKIVIYGAAGTVEAQKEGYHRMDCEGNILKKAKEIGANAVLPVAESFTVVSKTKGKHADIGAIFNLLQRLGNMSGAIAPNFGLANAIGDGYAEPYISAYFLKIQ